MKIVRFSLLCYAICALAALALFWATGAAPFLFILMGVAFLIALPILLAHLIAPVWKKSDRRRRGLCPKCGYNLAANLSGTCPECGTPVGPSEFP